MPNQMPNPEEIEISMSLKGLVDNVYWHRKYHAIHGVPLDSMDSFTFDVIKKSIEEFKGQSEETLKRQANPEYLDRVLYIVTNEEDWKEDLRVSIYTLYFSRQIYSTCGKYSENWLDGFIAECAKEAQKKYDEMPDGKFMEKKLIMEMERICPADFKGNITVIPDEAKLMELNDILELECHEPKKVVSEAFSQMFNIELKAVDKDTYVMDDRTEFFDYNYIDSFMDELKNVVKVGTIAITPRESVLHPRTFMFLNGNFN